MTQMDRDMRACVNFFLWDPWAMFRALRTHKSGVHDRCVQRCGPFPCLSYSTASFAEEMHRARMKHVVAPVSEADAPFRAAIHANSIETTTPMRAVSKTTTAGTSGGTATPRRK